MTGDAGTVTLGVLPRHVKALICVHIWHVIAAFHGGGIFGDIPKSIGMGMRANVVFVRVTGFPQWSVGMHDTFGMYLLNT